MSSWNFYRWSLGPGMYFENHKTQFLNFNKKVQGLSTNFTFGTDKNKTNVFASAALVGANTKSTLLESKVVRVHTS
jgi:hypothetical protein